MACGRSQSAFQTRSGVRGRSRITTPVASRTAAATAGAVQSKAPSLIPLAPRCGTGAVGVLDDVALQLDGQIHAGRDPVVDRPQVPRIRPRLVKSVVLHQGVAETLDRRTLVLAADLEQVASMPTSETVT